MGERRCTSAQRWRRSRHRGHLRFGRWVRRRRASRPRTQSDQSSEEHSVGGGSAKAARASSRVSSAHLACWVGEMAGEVNTVSHFLPHFGTHLALSRFTTLPRTHHCSHLSSPLVSQAQLLPLSHLISSYLILSHPISSSANAAPRRAAQSAAPRRARGRAVPVRRE